MQETTHNLPGSCKCINNYQLQTLAAQGASSFSGPTTEGLRSDGAGAPAVLAERAKQAVEFGLHASTHGRYHHRGHARQCKRAIAGKGGGSTAHALSERWIEQEIGELSQKSGRRRYLSSYR
ncbi:hypothetical protein ACLKMY_30920 [Paraburkholderia mimosarum]|uniref:hypothetical protein n=1 Tax=Paraburkholderia mimosarum TaxID=312026 RepID=UPI0012B65A92|nr:hypothetical protein [Paraburkholderia mimosarum]